VVHVDGTARPQILDPETAPDFYQIAKAYQELTGIPSLINTSFNMHGEPIVCTPEDALRSFQQGKLDYLAIGNWLVANSELRKNGNS
jgi:carbamoyltransferase